MSLPTSLEAAVAALEVDHGFLLEDEVFDTEMIQEWITTKRAEDIEIRKRPHPYEVERYFDI